MLAKLALRNTRRQLGNYVIYFITVSLTVALMFAVNNVIFEKELIARSDSIKELRTGLIVLTVFISLIVSFVLGYATAFMLRMRKREFGTYLTLGMTRRNILAVFVCEMLFLCLASLGAGLLLGLLFYQGLMAVVTTVMEVGFSPAAYSLRGLLLTIGLVFAVFVLASVTSAVYLQRVSIHTLLHGDRKQEKEGKHPAAWLAVTVAALLTVVLAIIGFSYAVKLLTTPGDKSEKGGVIMLTCLLILAVGIVLFHIGLCKSAIPLLLTNKTVKSRGTNTFTLRQLSGKLSANAVMCGALAFLLAFAVIGANVAFTLQIGNKAALNKSHPFDIAAQFSYDEDAAVPLDQAESIIEQYAHITNKIAYDVYRSQNNYLHTLAQDESGGYDADYDDFITVSDYNAFYGSLGYEKLSLDDGFKIIPYYDRVKSYDFTNAVLRLGDKSYAFSGFIDVEAQFPAYNFFLAVIPDDAAAFLKKASYGAAYTVSPAKYDANALYDALSYEHTAEWGGIRFSYTICDYMLRELQRLQLNAQNAVYIVAALYVALVFVFLTMAVLALKTLSGVADDRRRYKILFRLGTTERQQSGALFQQTFLFFFLPLVLPLLLGIPTAAVCCNIMRYAGMAAAVPQTVGAACGIVLVIAAVYTLYFTATYLLTRRSVLYRT